MYRLNIFTGISKGSIEIAHKICYLYIEKCVFYSEVKFWQVYECFEMVPFDFCEAW